MTSYFEVRSENNGIVLTDNEQPIRMYRKGTLSTFGTFKRSYTVQYALLGEGMQARQAHVYSMNRNGIYFFRNPTDYPVHIYGNVTSMKFRNIYSTAWYPVNERGGGWAAVANCSREVAEQIICYEFRTNPAYYSALTSVDNCGIEIYNANGKMIFNDEAKTLRILYMNELTHCAFGNELELSGYTDVNVTHSFDKPIAMSIGYRGLYCNWNPNYSGHGITSYSKDSYLLFPNAHFVVPILSKNSLTMQTAWQNNLLDVCMADTGDPGITYPHASSDYPYVISGDWPCNRTTYMIADTTNL